MSVPDVPAGGRPDPLGAAARVLVSDADRARIADVIGNAYAEGRLTNEEYQDRLTATMGARTAADLVPVLDGLPPVTVSTALAPLVGMTVAVPGAAGDVDPAGGWYPQRGVESSGSSVVAVFGGATRKGQWVMPTQLTAFAMFGGVELDLTRATFSAPECEITAVAVFGGVDITVPEGLTVHVEGIGIFGGFDQRAEGPGVPGAPVLRIKGAAFFGGVDVKRPKRRKGRKSMDGPDRPQLPEA
ncbi:MAG: DUF1707 domain-containing protein [Candidatus Nanopelagicales bacterium]